MGNTTTVRTSLKTAAFARFSLAQYTRTVYSFDSVENETSGIEMYVREDGIDMFIGYADPTTVVGELCAAAIAVAPAVEGAQW